MSAAAGQPAARAARPGDFALLFRALTNVEYYEEALRRYGIDYYLVGGRAFYAQQEIYDLLNLLRTLDSPCDVVSLAGVLRSPMFGLSDETLFWILRAGDCPNFRSGDCPIFAPGTVPIFAQAKMGLSPLRCPTKSKAPSANKQNTPWPRSPTCAR